MDFKKLELQNQTEYDAYVAEHSAAFLQSWSWGDWQQQLGKPAHRFFIIDQGATKLSAQIIEIPVPHLGSYLYIPYGPVGTIESSTFRLLVAGLKKEFPKSIFIRIESTTPLPPSTYPLQPTKHIQPGKTLVLDLTKTEEQLLADMHPKTRYNIKVAQKHGVQVATKTALSDEARTLISETARRQGYRSQSGSYFSDLVANLQKQTKALIYEAHYQNKLLATAIMVDFANTRTYLFGGSSDEHKNVMSRYLLHWQAIQDAKQYRMTKYDFWGIETASGETPGFVRFKLGFGGEEIQYPNCADLPQNRLLYYIYKLARALR